MLEKRYANILLISSFSILKLSYLLHSMGFNKIAFVYFLLFLTSVNHWKNPAYDSKRHVDIAMVIITTIMSSFYTLIQKKYYIEYHTTAFYCLALYMMSNLFYKHEYYFLSTIAHAKIHLTCLIGNYKIYKLLRLYQ